MKFYRYDTPTIMSGLVVRYQMEHSGGQVNASRQGVGVQGSWPIMDDEEIEIVYALMKRASEQANALNTRELFSKPTALPFAGDPECVTEYRRYRVFSTDEYEVIETREQQASPSASEGEGL